MKETTEWRNEQGKLHREDGPAVELDNGDKSWWVNGKLHREDGHSQIPDWIQQSASSILANEVIERVEE